MIALVLGAVLGGPLSPEVVAQVRASVREVCRLPLGDVRGALEDLGPSLEARPERRPAPVGPLAQVELPSPRLGQVVLGEPRPRWPAYGRPGPPEAPEVGELIRRRVGSLRYCFERALRTKLPGPTRFELHVSTRGDTPVARLEPRPEGAFFEVGRCLEQTAARWPWPRGAEVTLPLVLSPGP